jgi:hypothetical protein
MVESRLTRRDLLSRLAAAAVMPVAVSCGRGPSDSSAARIKGPLHYSSLADVATLIAGRELTSIDITQQLLARIAAVDGRCRAT